VINIKRQIKRNGWSNKENLSLLKHYNKTTLECRPKADTIFKNGNYMVVSVTVVEDTKNPKTK
jgi:hypothetical protein